MDPHVPITQFQLLSAFFQLADPVLPTTLPRVVSEMLAANKENF